MFKLFCKEDLIVNRYRVETKLGENSFKVEDKLSDTMTERRYKVIVKIANINSRLSLDALRESNMIKGVKSEFFLKFYESFLDSNCLNIVREYSQDPDLFTLLIKASKSQIPFDESRVQSWMIQMLQGLFYIHSLGISHGNLTTSNIYLCNEQIKIGEFGNFYIRRGIVKYLAPEVLLGGVCDDKADIWAIGCIFFELFMMKHAFDVTNDDLETVRNVLAVNYLPFSNDKMPLYAQTLILRIFVKNPIKRPSSQELLMSILHSESKPFIGGRLFDQHNRFVATIIDWRWLGASLTFDLTDPFGSKTLNDTFCIHWNGHFYGKENIKEIVSSFSSSTNESSSSSKHKSREFESIIDEIYFGIPHTWEYMQQLIEYSSGSKDCAFYLDQSVEVTLFVNERQSFLTGVVKWMGFHPGHPLTDLVGIALDFPLYHGATNGQFPDEKMQEKGKRLFTCEDNCAILVPKSIVKADYREAIFFESNNCHDPVAWEEELKATEPKFISIECQAFHKNKTYLHLGSGFGIQGRANSCYMDTALFALFAFNDTFDFILHDKIIASPEVDYLRKILREGIVYPLRRNSFVRQATMMEFREVFQCLTHSSGMTCDQKDSEEFLSLLFEKAFEVGPFLRFKSKDTCFIFQLFLEKRHDVLSVQNLLELTINLTENDKLNFIPDNLIVILPRMNNEYLLFNLLDLSLTMDLNPVLNCPIRDATVELYAVLCIEFSHYVAFVRDVAAKTWYFFDSMANRVGCMNIPCVERVDDLENWLTNEYSIHINNFRTLPSNLTELQRRLLTSAYILFYRKT